MYRAQSSAMPDLTELSPAKDHKRESINSRIDEEDEILVLPAKKVS